MSYQSFKKWHSEFIDKNGGFSPFHLEYWYKQVNRSHEYIRHVLGGEMIQRFYKLEAHQKQANSEDLEICIDKIVKMLPDYLKSYSYSREVFKQPLVPIGTHKVIKISKHIRSYADCVLCNIYGENEYAIRMRELDNLISMLGSFWSQARTSEQELEITISTTQKGFIWLGHYGPDIESCFKQNGRNEKDKFVLGQSANTFVITIAKKIDNVYRNIARCFGFLSELTNIFNITNYYFIENFQEGDAIEVMTKLFEDILGKKLVLFTRKTCLDKYIYANEYGNWSFVEQSRSLNGIESQILHSNANNIKKFYCPKCDRNNYCDELWQEVDNLLICKKCSINAKQCEESCTKTFGPIHEIMMSNGIIGKVNLARFPGISCYDCGQLHIKSFVINDKLLCEDCADNTTTCDCCNKTILIDDLISINDMDLCQECGDLYACTQPS